MGTRTAAIIFVLIAILVAVGFALKGGDGHPEDMDALARVDDSVITVARFNRSYLGLLMAGGGNDTPLARMGHLDKLIQDRLLADEARRRGMDRTEAYQQHLERHRALAAGAMYFRTEFAETLPELTEAEIRDAYEKSTQQVVLRQLFFRDPARAALAAARLMQGEDFIDLANEVFETAEYDTLAGFLGVARFFELDDPVAEVAFNLQVGEISPPVQSSHGWHILRVEEKLRNPLLIEEEYQRRREGIAGRAVIRRNRIQGDAWIRSLMESADVVVDREGSARVVAAVEEALGQEDSGTGAPRPSVLRPSEIGNVREDLQPDTPLAAYLFAGEEHLFTAADFLRWLPELPYDEVRDRPIAAVGRALRNELLGLYGTGAGLDRVPEAREAIDYQTDLFLAQRLRAHLRTAGGVEPTSAEIEEAFERLGMAELREARADYWTIAFPDFASANQARRQVESGDRTPESFQSFTRVVDGDILSDGMAGHLRRMPLGDVHVVCPADGSCSVARVERRSLVRTTLEEKREEIAALLRRLLPEERMSDSLRAGARVDVDSTLFREMMEH